MLPAAQLLYINCTDMQMTGTRNTVTTPVAARSVFFIFIYFYKVTVTSWAWLKLCIKNK